MLYGISKFLEHCTEKYGAKTMTGSNNTQVEKKEKHGCYQASSGPRTKSSTWYLLSLHYTQIFGELKNMQVV